MTRELTATQAAILKLLHQAPEGLDWPAIFDNLLMDERTNAFQTLLGLEALGMVIEVGTVWKAVENRAD